MQYRNCTTNASLLYPINQYKPVFIRVQHMAYNRVLENCLTFCLGGMKSKTKRPPQIF